MAMVEQRAFLRHIRFLMVMFCPGGRREENQLDHPVHPKISETGAIRLTVLVRQPGLLSIPRPDCQQPQRVLWLHRQQTCPLLLEE